MARYGQTFKDSAVARLQPPQDIPNVGRFAVVPDLHGAVFILFKANKGVTPEAPAPFWTHSCHVEALDAAMSRAKLAGGQVLIGPQEVPGPMFIANCQDPQCAWSSMVAPRR